METQKSPPSAESRLQRQVQDLRIHVLETLEDARHALDLLNARLALRSKRGAENLLFKVGHAVQNLDAWVNRQNSRLSFRERQEAESDLYRDEISRMESEGGVPPVVAELLSKRKTPAPSAPRTQKRA